MGEKLVGLLCAHQCLEDRDWQPTEFSLLQQLATQVGFALDQAHLIEQLNRVSQQQAQQTDALRQQLVSLIRDVEGAANGDLTVRAETQTGEIRTIADFFNGLVGSLQEIAVQVKQATTQVNTSLRADEAAVRQLSADALKQSQGNHRYSQFS